MSNKRRKRKRRKRRDQTEQGAGPSAASIGAVPSRLDHQGFHFLVPDGFTAEESFEKLQQQYRQAIRDSELWPLMVAEYGKEKAEKLLEQCCVQLR